MAKNIVGISIKNRMKRTVTGFNYGLIIVYMRDFGRMIKLQVMEGLFLLMETCTLANGKQIKHTGMVSTIIMKVQRIRVIGWKINRKAMAEKNGQIIHIMKAAMFPVKNKGLGHFNGLMVRNIKDSGKVIKCMVKANSNGPMVEFIKEIIRMTKSMDKVFILGLTVDYIMEDSLTGNNTEREYIHK